MDDPAIDPALHEEALRGLARINRVSFSASALWHRIANVARDTGRPIRVLDVATGSGDIPTRLYRRAVESGLPVTFAACDISEVALDHARQTAKEAAADVNFFVANPIAEDIPRGYDVILSSLFLHHLTEVDAVVLLRRIHRAAGRAVLISDLRRSFAGYLLARTATRALTRSPVVHVDGPRSVEGAFTMAEARALAVDAGWTNVEVTPLFPCRYLLSWRRA